MTKKSMDAVVQEPVKAIQPDVYLALSSNDEPPHIAMTKDESKIAMSILVEVSNVKKAAVYANHRGMQTDPRLDPLGAWSQGVTSDQSWRPPMPPSRWLDFDPTINKPDEETKQTNASIAVSMLKGTDPSEIREETMHCVKFVERELSRITKGIRGFAEYTNCLVDRETKHMTKANSKLKLHLSKTELMALDNVVTKSTDRKKRDNRNIEEKIKSDIVKVGEEAIRILHKIKVLLDSSLRQQYEEYEYIYLTLQGSSNKSISFHNFEIDDDTNYLLGAKRSRSHNDLQPGDVIIDTSLLLRTSKSNIILQNTNNVETRSKHPEV